jgi:hypothetical protein
VRSVTPTLFIQAFLLNFTFAVAAMGLHDTAMSVEKGNHEKKKNVRGGSNEERCSALVSLDWRGGGDSILGDKIYCPGFFNEEENLPILIPQIVEVLRPLGKTYEMIFVDDGSTDRSRQLLKGMEGPSK